MPYGLVARSGLKIRRDGCLVEASLAFNRCGISELGVAALAVVEDLEKSGYRVGEVDSGAPILFGSELDLHRRLERFLSIELS